MAFERRHRRLQNLHRADGNKWLCVWAAANTRRGEELLKRNSIGQEGRTVIGTEFGPAVKDLLRQSHGRYRAAQSGESTLQRLMLPISGSPPRRRSEKSPHKDQ